MDIQAVEKCRRRRDSLFFMVQGADAALNQRGGRGFAKVVADGSQHQDNRLRPLQVRDPVRFEETPS